MLDAELERLLRSRQPGRTGAAARSRRRVRLDGLPEPRPRPAGSRRTCGPNGRSASPRGAQGRRERASGGRSRTDDGPRGACRLSPRRRGPPRLRARHGLSAEAVETRAALRAALAERVLLFVHRPPDGGARRGWRALRSRIRRGGEGDVLDRAAAARPRERSRGGVRPAAARDVHPPAAAAAPRLRTRVAARRANDGHRAGAADLGARGRRTARAPRSVGPGQQRCAAAFRHPQRLQGRAAARDARRRRRPRGRDIRNRGAERALLARRREPFLPLPSRTPVERAR